MKDMGTIILEIEIKRDLSYKKIFSCQRKCNQMMLRRFGIEHAKDVSTPLTVFIVFLYSILLKSMRRRKAWLVFLMKLNGKSCVFHDMY